MELRTLNDIIQPKIDQQLINEDILKNCDTPSLYYFFRSTHWNYSFQQLVISPLSVGLSFHQTSFHENNNQ